jgi:c-di-GMP-binding flagellar brake protein YcgR
MSNETNITTAVGILSALRKLIEKRELLKTAFNHGKDGYTTLLLEADENRKLLLIDAPRDRVAMQRLLGSDKVYFSGMLGGSRVRFACVRPVEIKLRNLPAVALNLPTTVTTIQDRESYRVKVMGKYCSVPIPGSGLAKAPIIDISVEGICLQLGTAGNVLSTGQVIMACTLDLGPLGKISCDLEARRVKRILGRGANVGFKFVNMPGRSQALVSQFVTQEERKKLTM